MAPITDLWQYPITSRLGWTLIAFLWQGAAIWAICAIALAALRRKSAESRYLVCCLALFLMSLCPIATFATLNGRLFEGTQALSAPAGAFQGEISWNRAGASERAGANLAGQSGLEKAGTWLLHGTSAMAGSLPAVDLLWGIGVLFLSLRLLAGWLAVRRLVSTASTPAPQWLTERASQIANRIGVHKPIAFYLSDAVEVPSVVGGLVALILMPASAITGLPPQALEALIAHELAHVRRCDHLVNMLQTVVEAVLFYHPGVWWVSRRIRQEREHCCDDLAVSATGDPLGYAQALSNMEHLRAAGATPVLAANDGDLVMRIRRIVNQPPCPTRAGILPSVVVAMALSALIATHAWAVPNNASRTMGPQAPAVLPAAAEGKLGQNILSNSSAEEGQNGLPAAWQQGAQLDGVTYFWDTENGHTGHASLCLKKTAHRFFPIAQWYQTVPFRSVPGKNATQALHASAWVKADHVTKAILDVQFLDANGNMISHQWAAYIGDKDSSDPPVTHDWTQYAGDVTIPQGTSSIAIGLQIYGPGRVWFDDVSASYISTAPAS